MCSLTNNSSSLLFIGESMKSFCGYEVVNLIQLLAARQGFRAEAIRPLIVLDCL
jgi:hypothetical protein